jgi:hypothetical protein
MEAVHRVHRDGTVGVEQSPRRCLKLVHQKLAKIRASGVEILGGWCGCFAAAAKFGGKGWRRGSEAAARRCEAKLARCSVFGADDD